MGTYKVLQDIEAEDKLLGPLTLKQFIFAIITVVLMFIAFMFAKVNIILATPWLIPILFFGFMASPIGRDQPNDVWLAARIRFLIKPRKRHWDQSGMQELVTITAPKKAEIIRTNGLDQTQVTSRLKALSATMDSRGWAVKNLGSNPMANAGFGGVTPSSDRLFDITTDAPVPDVDIRANDDILDPVSNMVAQRFDTDLKEQRQDNLSRLKDIASGKTKPTVEYTDYSFITEPSVDPGYTSFGAQVVGPTGKSTSSDTFLEQPSARTADEVNFLSHVHESKDMDKKLADNGHGKVIAPITPPKNPASPQPAKLNEPTTNTSTGRAPDDILEKLGQSSELNVTSLASLAKHAEGQAALKQDEVVSLH